MRQFADKLKDKLQKNLPGEQAQYLMAPLHRHRLETETLRVEQFRPSAVMLLLCLDDQDEYFIPLIERMSYNGAHSAQISLPGGKFDEGDKDLEATAIRECFEEIGVSELKVIGRLTKLFIPVSNFVVHPFVAVCKVKNPAMKVQEREVKTLLQLPLKKLMDQNIVEQGSIDVFDNLNIKTAWFNVEGHKVWGATAMILSEFKELLRTIS